MFDLICGVPYTALPMATIMSHEHGVPMLVRRKEGAKQHGTGKEIEGHFEKGQTCLVVEDLVTSGMSVFETIDSLEAAGVKVKDVIVLLDRQQGAKENINKRGYNLHSVLTISELLQVLETEKKLDADTVQRMKEFITNTQVLGTGAPVEQPKPLEVKKAKRYSERAELCSNPTAKELLKLMDEKRTNLCVALDVTTKAEVLQYADTLGPYICCLKTHADIIEDFDQDLVSQLSELAKKHKFLIFEDRKFADIGNTVKYQYEKGVHRIAEWSHITNAHIVPGPGIIAGLKEVGLPRGRGLLLLAEMSSAGTMAKGDYTTAAIQMARENRDFVIGFISMRNLFSSNNSATESDDAFIHMTPGVQLGQKGDALGQQYNTPEDVIGRLGSDVIIVGRGIYTAKDIPAEAERYREAGWKAYAARCGF
eukprot:GEZU01036003.1.p1 GENE.GEZU01036003.1~~GEZU01036003.1.p1  ORF type:complete len:497 (-),score=161.54 GEZU01036003.1:38-1306(-)